MRASEWRVLALRLGMWGIIKKKYDRMTLLALAGAYLIFSCR